MPKEDRIKVAENFKEFLKNNTDYFDMTSIGPGVDNSFTYNILDNKCTLILKVFTKYDTFVRVELIINDTSDGKPFKLADLNVTIKGDESVGKLLDRVFLSLRKRVGESTSWLKALRSLDSEFADNKLIIDSKDLIPDIIK